MNVQTILFNAMTTLLLVFCNYYLFSDADHHLQSLQKIRKLPLNSTEGPESLAFDCKGKGPYTGVSDGRVLKWSGHRNKVWKDFATTSPNWRKKICNGSDSYTMEPTCGRPLGLKFNNKTCQLYIADAYYGLMVVGPKGGKAKSLVTKAGGVPLKLTNSLDVNQETGVVYFTDSSTRYQRRDYLQAIFNGDSTGRLIEYNTKTKKSRILLKGMAFANGVALSKSKRYLLVAETGTARIMRYWLKGNKATKVELFSKLKGMPDNIKRNKRGEFWVAIVIDSGLLKKCVISNRTRDGNHCYGLADTLESSAIKFNEKGVVLKELEDLGGAFQSITELNENVDGTLFLGSLSMPYVGIYEST